MKYSPSTYTDDNRRQHEHEKDRHGSDEKDTTPSLRWKNTVWDEKIHDGIKNGIIQCKRKLSEFEDKAI